MTTKPPKFAPVTGEAALAMRQKAGTNQSVFWSRVGIGQSAGSRYESGRNTRRGTGWVKKNPASTSQEAMK